MRADGTSSNPMLDDCFYATFDSSGVLHEKLNPQDLTQVIATWDNVYKEWISASGASHITTEDTMFCIPTTYMDGNSTSISLRGYGEDGGSAYAHTIGGHTYEYLAIGVYEGFKSKNMLMSWSGKVSTGNESRSGFRSYATSKTVQNGHAMVWNFYQWNLWRIMTIFAMKSFNGQSQIGRGGPVYTSETQGKCNAMGPFAGRSSRDYVKAFIEAPWGFKYEFIDDFVCSYGNTSGRKIWIGQNIIPTDTPTAAGGTASDKTSYVWSIGATGFPNAILSDAPVWGIGNNSAGSNTTGLCDKHAINTNTGVYIGSVGGYYSDESDGSAGPSFLHTSVDTGTSEQKNTARLAFVFDI